MSMPAAPNSAALAPGQQSDLCRFAFAASVAAGLRCDEPFEHWVLAATLPDQLLRALARLPLTPPPRDTPEAARTAYVGRHYVTPALIDGSPVCGVVADAFQAEQTVTMLEAATGADLAGCFLRIELALDVDGFRLEPHTDLGVKRFTLLTYVDSGGQRELGTDLYRDRGTWAKQVAFAPGVSLMFVPSDRTWHGFEPRVIRAVRRSLIVNYVTPAWRDRDQLAFPDRPVRAVS